MFRALAAEWFSATVQPQTSSQSKTPTD